MSEPSRAGQRVPAHDVADDVGVAHKDLVAVLLLLGISSVNEVPKSSLDPSSIFVILLKAPRSQLQPAHGSTEPASLGPPLLLTGCTLGPQLMLKDCRLF